MRVVCPMISWCWRLVVVVATDVETTELVVRVRAACNESIRDSVERPNYAIPFRSSDVILVRGELVHSAKLRVCIWISIGINNENISVKGSDGIESNDRIWNTCSPVLKLVVEVFLRVLNLIWWHGVFFFRVEIETVYIMRTLNKIQCASLPWNVWKKKQKNVFIYDLFDICSGQSLTFVHMIFVY